MSLLFCCTDIAKSVGKLSLQEDKRISVVLQKNTAGVYNVMMKISKTQKSQDETVE